jgi:hypothetical protein
MEAMFSLCSGVWVFSGGMKRHLILMAALGLSLTGFAAAAEPVRLGVSLWGGGDAGVYAGARLELAQDRRDDRDRNRGLDQAIQMVLKRTRGSFVSAEPTGDDNYRVVVRIGNRIVAYRVNLRNGSMDEE